MGRVASAASANAAVVHFYAKSRGKSFGQTGTLLVTGARFGGLGGDLNWEEIVPVP
jgi:hypothetical protein